MSQQFLGEIRIVTFGFAPRGWATCDGQILPINQNSPLFSLLGTNYGGNGTNTFALPNFQGSIPVHTSGQYNVGLAFGEYSHTLSLPETPAHTHQVNTVPSTGTKNDPTGNAFAEAAASPRYTTLYGTGSSETNFNSTAISSVGASQPHENRQPTLTLNFIIALTGIFPSRS